MAFNPNEPRDSKGQWTAGGGKITRIKVRRVNQDNGNVKLANHIADQHKYEGDYKKEFGIAPPPEGISVSEFQKRLEHAGKTLFDYDPVHRKALFGQHGATYREAWSPVTRKEAAMATARMAGQYATAKLRQTFKSLGKKAVRMVPTESELNKRIKKLRGY